MARKTQPKQTNRKIPGTNSQTKAPSKSAKHPGGKNLRRHVLEMMGPKAKAIYK